LHIGMPWEMQHRNNVPSLQTRSKGLRLEIAVVVNSFIVLLCVRTPRTLLVYSYQHCRRNCCSPHPQPFCQEGEAANSSRTLMNAPLTRNCATQSFGETLLSQYFTIPQ
jgi:hypothetical protein